MTGASGTAGGRLAVAVVVALLPVAACSGPADAVAGATVRDSSGVRIVENRAAAGGRGVETWTVLNTPLLDLGGETTADSELYQVMGAARLQDGRIVVASAGTQQLRIYGPDGRLIRSIGGAGDGPGEFRFPSWVGTLAADSIAAWDAALGRLSVFTPAGELARVATPARPLGFAMQAVGALADGRLLLSAGGTGAAPPQGRAYRDTVTYVVLGGSGEVLDTIGRFPGTEMVALGSPTTGLLMRTLPFGRQTVAAVHGSRVYVATGDSYEVAAYEPGEGLRALFRARRERLSVTPDDIRDYRQSVVTLGAEGDAQLRRQQQEMLERAPYPETMPALSGLRVDADGNLWIEEPRRPGDERGSVWTVFTPDGQVRASVRVPHGVAVHQVGRDWVLGVALDADHVEHVRLYRLDRTA